jgi:dolichol kinase
VSALVDSIPSVPDSETWASLRRELGDAYDALVAALPADASEPRPTNLHRASFHMGSAVAGLVATLLVFDTAYLPIAASTLAAIAWTLELLRRRSPSLNASLMRGFGRIARPGEASRVNSGTWYLTALVVLTLTFSPLLCVVSVAVLGFADPAAALVGRRLGRTPLRLGRTLEGTVAFVVAGTLAAMLVMQLLPVAPAPGVAWPVAIAAALGGALAELFSRRVDDNLSIPLAAMASAWAALAALGATPW